MVWGCHGNWNISFRPVQVRVGNQIPDCTIFKHSYSLQAVAIIKIHTDKYEERKGFFLFFARSRLLVCVGRQLLLLRHCQGQGLIYHNTLQSAHIWSITKWLICLSNCSKVLHRFPFKVSYLTFQNKFKTSSSLRTHCSHYISDPAAVSTP